MYRGFNLKLKWEHEEYYNKGLALYQSYESTTQDTLDEFLLKDGSIDGTKLQSNWFPQIPSEIFISHSHKDEKMAIALSGWLFEKFGIHAFIDSCIWGYADHLLKIIDNEYCRNKNGSTFNYQKRNSSTAHVHMILSTALNMMIDKTECLFFLNTPNSISTLDVIDKTESSWIYSEITTTQIIRKEIPERLRKEE